MWQLLWGHRRYEKCYNGNPEDTAEDTGCNWHQPNPKIRVGVKVLVSEDEAVGGGPATAGALEGIASQLSFSELSQDA